MSAHRPYLLSANGNFVAAGGPGKAGDGMGEGTGVHQGELGGLLKTAHDTTLRGRRDVLLEECSPC